MIAFMFKQHFYSSEKLLGWSAIALSLHATSALVSKYVFAGLMSKNTFASSNESVHTPIWAGDLSHVRYPDSASGSCLNVEATHLAK